MSRSLAVGLALVVEACGPAGTAGPAPSASRRVEASGGRTIDLAATAERCRAIANGEVRTDV